jgi:hypothetical protein
MQFNMNIAECIEEIDSGDGFNLPASSQTAFF